MTRRTAVASCLAASAALMLAVPRDGRAAEPADLVLTNAVVHTVDAKRPRAEAVAVRGRRIVAVGTSAEVQALVGPKTRVLDLRGRTVVPGFDDSHAHLLGIGFARLDVDLVGTRSFAEVVDRVARAVKSRRPGEWIRGRGWHEGKWDAPFPGSVRGFPTHEALTAVSPDNPVVLERADGHAVLANARAMALAGISRATKTPDGGEIIHDASGDPTGVFVDRAEGLVAPPDRSPDEVRRALELAMDECLPRQGRHQPDRRGGFRRGDRRLQGGGRGGEAAHPALRDGGGPADDEGPGAAGGGPGERHARGARGEALRGRRARLARRRAPRALADDPGNSGLLVTPPDGILEAARFALAHGFQVGTHAIGDRANRVVLDAYDGLPREPGPKRTPASASSTRKTLDAADIPRFGRLGVLAAMQGIHCPSDRPWAPKRLGEARVAEGASCGGRLLDTGARILNGTDAPVEDLSPNPELPRERDPQDASGRPPGGFDPDQKLTRAEALRTMTLDAAYGSFETDKGSIEVGKLADLVVLSQDVLRPRRRSHRRPGSSPHRGREGPLREGKGPALSEVETPQFEPGPLGRLTRLARRRQPPGTPAGTCRKRARPT